MFGFVRKQKVQEQADIFTLDEWRHVAPGEYVWIGDAGSNDPRGEAVAQYVRAPEEPGRYTYEEFHTKSGSVVGWRWRKESEE